MIKYYNNAVKDINNTVVIKEDKKRGWVMFGDGDNYPIEFIKNIGRSPVATSVIETTQSFIKGGNLDPSIANMIVNSGGQTFEEFHESCCYDIALNLGCYINVRYNQNGQVTELRNLSFEHTRAGIPDDMGYINEYKYIPELYNSQVKANDKQVIEFDVFNPDAAIDQIVNSEIYNGQVKAIRFMRPNATGQRVYPIPVLNSAISYIEVDYRMGNFHVNAIRNNFHKSHIFTVKGVSPDEKDPSGEFPTMREKIESQLNEMIGDDSAGGVFVQYAQNINDKIDIESLDSSDDDKRYTTLDNMVVSKIATASNVPPILANIKTSGSLGDSQEIENAVSVFNGKTEKYRNGLSGFYNTIGLLALPNSPLKQLSTFEIPLFDFKLLGKETESSNQSLPLGGEDDNIEGDAEAESKNKEAQANLRGSVGGVQGILSISESLNNGTTTVSSAINILENIYGFDNETAKAILGVK